MNTYIVCAHIHTFILIHSFWTGCCWLDLHFFYFIFANPEDDLINLNVSICHRQSKYFIHSKITGAMMTKHGDLYKSCELNSGGSLGYEVYCHGRSFIEHLTV